MTHHEPSPIDGWNVDPGDDGATWTARRRSSLSALQLEYGCRLVVGASSLGELGVLITAEEIKAGIVAAAERLADRMVEADRHRRGQRP